MSCDFSTSWIPVDPKKPDLKRFPLYTHASPWNVSFDLVRCCIPAMWYHRVAQKDFTIAVNYWYDMHFGHSYVYHHFVKDLMEAKSDSKEEMKQKEESEE